MTIVLNAKFAPRAVDHDTTGAAGLTEGRSDNMYDLSSGRLEVHHERHITHLNTRWLMISAGLLLLALLLPKTGAGPAPAPHQYITEYVGPAPNATCHGDDVVNDVVHSVHYTWRTKRIITARWLVPSPVSTGWGGHERGSGIPAGCGRCHRRRTDPCPSRRTR